jgi:hypothetical protein
MKQCKKCIVGILCILLVVSLTGCSSISLLTRGEFDASGYVEGLMDASYKADFDQYIKLTEDTKENAEAAYDTIMSTKAKAFATYTGVTLTKDSEALLLEYTRKIYQNAKYTVLEANKNDNGFSVQVVISPITVFDHISKEGEAFVADFNTRNENAEFADLTQEEFEAEYAKGILKIFENNSSNISYGKEITVTVNVSKEENNTYTVTTEEFTKIDNAILQ